ncbi:MAG: shikimate dehydrogenase [Gemmatimonas sp.]|nr:shikimate dehydrogenase [Gemmatimonas sp.]
MLRELPWNGFVILGHPVAHSLSPVFQNAALEAIGAKQRYERLDVPPASLRSAFDLLQAHRIVGNVTIPHKEAVAQLATQLTPPAERTGAVNTFWWDGDDLVGHNTDVAGADASIMALCPDGVSGPAVVLGAGGSAAAVLYALSQRGVRDIHVVVRDGARAEALLARLACNGTVHAHDALPQSAGVARGPLQRVLAEAALVVNCTPIGLQGPDHPLPLSSVGPMTALFDLVYTALGTDWIRAAQAAGKRAEDGLRMLVEQGAAAFEVWTGERAPRDVMWRALCVPAPSLNEPRSIQPAAAAPSH